MSFRITYSQRFRREIKQLGKHYPSIKSDLQRLANDLLINPYAGVDLGRGRRKVRVAIASKNKGKSGGARVITLNCLVEDGVLVLLSIYDKQRRASVTPEEVEQYVSEYLSE